MNRRSFLTLLGAAGVTVAMPPVIGSSKWLEELMPAPIKTASGEAGWQKLSDGRLIQWGTFNGNGVIEFPVAFGSGDVLVQCMSRDQVAVMIEKVASMGFVTKHHGPLMWVAIGRA